MAKTIEPMATKNGNRLVINCGGPWHIHADQTRFRQSLLNLTSNANKFTENGTITIAARQGQENGRDWITLAVSDTGIGMTASRWASCSRNFPRLPRPRRANTAAPALVLRSAGVSVG